MATTNQVQIFAALCCVVVAISFEGDASRIIRVSPAPEGKGIHGGYVPPKEGPQLETILFKVAAVGLPSTDPFRGEPDPFIQISYANGSSSDFVNFARTSTLIDQHEATWGDIIKFEKYIQGAGQRLQFEVRDHDVADWDDHIGHAYIDLDQCVRDSRRDRTEKRSCYTKIGAGNGLLYMSIL